MPAGKLHIKLHHRAGQVEFVEISSSRPTISQVLLSKTPEQVLTTVQLLFTLCGTAQAYAALLVCREALAIPGNAEIDIAREFLLHLETLRELSLRVTLDWPVLLGQTPDKTPLAALLKYQAQCKDYLFTGGDAFSLHSRLNINSDKLKQLINDLTRLIDTAIFNGQLATFLKLDTEAQLGDWLAGNPALAARMLNEIYSLNWQAVGTNEVDCLPELNSAEWHRQLLATDLAGFVDTPHWQGQRWESTPLNRQLSTPLIFALKQQYGNGLLVRYAAVLQEIATITHDLQPVMRVKSPVATAYSAGNIQLSQVQAARGLLLHRLELRQGQVYDYRIVAPTEWNFQTEGVVAQGLKQLQADDINTLQRQAEWLICAVDPCVPYKLELISN